MTSAGIWLFELFRRSDTAPPVARDASDEVSVPRIESDSISGVYVVAVYQLIGGAVARIRSFQPMKSDVRPHPTEVDCGYQVIVDDATTYVHLSTFGSDERRSDKKVSQTLQIDREMAGQLVALLQATFPGI